MVKVYEIEKDSDWVEWFNGSMVVIFGVYCIDICVHDLLCLGSMV